MLHERVTVIIGHLAGVKPEEIGPGNALGEHASANRFDPLAQCRPLGLDSMDRVELVQHLEEEFHITISDDEVDRCGDCVGDLNALVADKLDNTPLELRATQELKRVKAPFLDGWNAAMMGGRSFDQAWDDYRRKL
jgi:acyl carrier protein